MLPPILDLLVFDVVVDAIDRVSRNGYIMLYLCQLATIIESMFVVDRELSTGYHLVGGVGRMGDEGMGLAGVGGMGRSVTTGFQLAIGIVVNIIKTNIWST